MEYTILYNILLLRTLHSAPFVTRTVFSSTGMSPSQNFKQGNAFTSFVLQYVSESVSGLEMWDTELLEAQ
jgi:hypothetical protein